MGHFHLCGVRLKLRLQSLYAKKYSKILRFTKCAQHFITFVIDVKVQNSNLGQFLILLPHYGDLLTTK